MLKKKQIELIQKALDGELSEQQKIELEEMLAANPEALQTHSELSEVFNFLADNPRIPPSPNLKKKILQSIDETRYAHDTMVERRRFSLPKFSKQDMKTLFAFAFGMIFGILIGTALLINNKTSHKIDETDLFGTIGITDANYFKIVDGVKLNLPEMEGRIAVKNYMNMYYFEVDITTVDRAQITFEFNDSDLSLYGFRPLTLESYELIQTQYSVTLEYDTHLHYGLLFSMKNPDDSYMKCALSQFGDIQYTHTFTLKYESN